MKMLFFCDSTMSNKDIDRIVKPFIGCDVNIFYKQGFDGEFQQENVKNLFAYIDDCDLILISGIDNVMTYVAKEYSKRKNKLIYEIFKIMEEETNET